MSEQKAKRSQLTNLRGFWLFANKHKFDHCKKCRFGDYLPVAADDWAWLLSEQKSQWDTMGEKIKGPELGRSFSKADFALKTCPDDVPHPIRKQLWAWRQHIADQMAHLCNDLPVPH